MTSAEVLDTYRRAVDRNRETLAIYHFEPRVTVALGCPVLYLDKTHWHNRGTADVPGQIFCSIWVDDKGRTNYNIHAFKLRNLKPYKLESRKFAEAFRQQLDRDGWPNVSTDFGPLTLMQGWIELTDQNLDLVIQGFGRVSRSIDDLLGQPPL